MRTSPPSRQQVVAAALMRSWIRSHWKGSTKGPTFLARHLSLLRSLPVRVDTQQLFVDLRDGLSHDLLAGSPWRTPPWEEDEQAVMRRIARHGDVVFDIGAHIGLHTILLSRLVGRTGSVHAFEPNPLRTHALRDTVRALGNATLYPFGLSNTNGQATLFVPEDQTMASLADWTEGRVGSVERYQPEFRTIDEVTSRQGVPRPDFVKCDVEGAEHAVFTGGLAMLDREDAPIILYEADSRSVRAFGLDCSEATALLKSLPRPRFDVFWVQPGAALRHIELPGGSCEHFNLLAVPAARRNRLAGMTMLSD